MLVKAPAASHICHIAAQVLTGSADRSSVPSDLENPQCLPAKSRAAINTQLCIQRLSVVLNVLPGFDLMPSEHCRMASFAGPENTLGAVSPCL
jgi:hypothetical protein